MNSIKKLAGETAIYGISTIVGRFLNWLLVPLYTHVFFPEEYGVVTNLMSYVAILLVLLTYGMETGYFRFANQKAAGPSSTFAVGFVSLCTTTMLFWLAVFTFLTPISKFLDVSENPEFIVFLALTLGIDAITALPFAKLRQENKPLRYAGIKLVNILVNLGINLFFLLLCPWISKNHPEIPIEKIWNPEIRIGYIFIAFFVSSLANLVLLLPNFDNIDWRVDWRLLRKILAYSSPILIISICGMININLDKMIMPKLIPENSNPLYQTGIYGANYKLAVIMTLFIQAFRYAFEPFFFSHTKEKDSRQVYADVLKYFVIFGLVIFLGVLFYIDIVKILIDSRYHEGLGIVPYILMANFLYGVFFSLSLWYKLTDKTRLGAYIALIGSFVTVALNLLLVPRIGYYGAAYAVLACFVVMAAISYRMGQKHYPVPYDLKRVVFYTILAVALYIASEFIKQEESWREMLLKTPLLVIFIFWVIKKEKPRSSLAKPRGFGKNKH